jgi:hypothetical protein
MAEGITHNGKGLPKPGMNARNVPPDIGELSFLVNLRRHRHKSKPVMFQESGFWQDHVTCRQLVITHYIENKNHINE